MMPPSPPKTEVVREWGVQNEKPSEGGMVIFWNNTMYTCYSRVSHLQEKEDKNCGR